MPGGGALPEKWGGPEVHLFKPSFAACKTPISLAVSVLKTLLPPPNHTFWKILSSKASNCAKLQFTGLHFVKQFSSQGSQIQQWSIHKPLCLTLRATQLYQNESWVPPPGPDASCKLPWSFRLDIPDLYLLQQLNINPEVNQHVNCDVDLGAPQVLTWKPSGKERNAYRDKTWVEQ